MYESYQIAEKIKAIAKSRNIVIKIMLEECGLSKNTLSSMASGGSTPKSENLAKIADYLNCSVDYLLGRTDNPNITADNYINGNNGIQAVNNGNNSNLTVNGNTRSDTEELVELIQGLPLVQRAKIITQIDEMKNKK